MMESIQQFVKNPNVFWAIIYLIGYICAFAMLYNFVVERNNKGIVRKDDYVIITVLSIGSWLWALIVATFWVYRIFNKEK